MKKLIVKEEHLPQRCEICHQIDLFNPEKVFCLRCNAYPQKEISKVKVITQIYENLSTDKLITTNKSDIKDLIQGAFILLSLAAGLIGGFYIGYNLYTKNESNRLLNGLLFSSLGIILAMVFPFLVFSLINFVSNIVKSLIKSIKEIWLF